MADLFEIPLQLNTDRKIIHVDMDAFYAQVEMRDHPEYRDVQLILARDPRTHGGRGVVATANYAARQLGVHSAQSSAEALRLAPDAVFIEPDFDKYRTVSAQVHEIFHRFTDKIEAIALDEAFLDVTENKIDEADHVAIAHSLQQMIFDQLRLTSSVGVSFNKFLAKLASENNKPVGLSVVRPDDVRLFLDRLPIEDIRGVGAKTAERMRALGVETGADLYAMDQSTLLTAFGKMGYEFYRRIRGVDNRPVEWQRERKSVGKERTYGPFLDTEEQVFAQLREIAGMLESSLQRRALHGKTLVIKVRDENFDTETRRRTEVDFLPNDGERFLAVAQDLWEELGGFNKPIRLLGLTMTNLAPLTFENVPLDLYGE
jgi:DNA polymerase-4